MAGEAIALVMSRSRIVDYGNDKVAAAVVVKETVVESKGVPSIGAVQRAAVNECHIGGIDKVMAAQGGARGYTHIYHTAVFGRQREGVGSIEELYGVKRAGGVNLYRGEELLAERVVVPVVDGELEMVGIAEATYGVGYH